MGWTEWSIKQTLMSIVIYSIMNYLAMKKKAQINVDESPFTDSNDGFDW